MSDDRTLASAIYDQLTTTHDGKRVRPRTRNGLVERYVDGRWIYLDGPEDDDRNLYCQVMRTLPKEQRLSDSRIRSISNVVKKLCDPAPRSRPEMRIGFADCDLRLDPCGVAKEQHSPDHDVRLRFDFPCPIWVPDPEFPELGDRFEPVLVKSNPLLRRFTSTMWTGVPDREQRWDVVWRFAGAALCEIATKYKRYLIPAGREDSGKSQVVKMIEGVIRAAGGTVAHVEVREFGDEYYRAVIASSHLNSVGDLDAADVKRSGRFKEIVAGDESSGRFAHGRPFSFQPTCAHIYACNELPTSFDRSGGWWNRPIVIPSEASIPEHLRVTGIMDELLATAMPEIVMLMIAGAIRLVRQGGYVLPPSSIAAAKEWREEDPVRQFVNECCVELEEPSTSVKTLYWLYRAYANAHGFASMSAITFGKRLTNIGIEGKKASTMHYALQVVDERVRGMVDAFDATRTGRREDQRDDRGGILPSDSAANPRN